MNHKEQYRLNAKDFAAELVKRSALLGSEDGKDRVLFQRASAVILNLAHEIERLYENYENRDKKIYKIPVNFTVEADNIQDACRAIMDQKYTAVDDTTVTQIYIDADRVS